MAVTNLQSNAYHIRPASGHVVPTRKGFAKASETWAIGSVLIRSSGQLAEASADPTADIVGIAAHAVTSASANDEVLYWPALPGTEFEATLEDQANEDHALVITNVYTDYGLQVDGNGIWYVDENETSSTSVIITGVLKAQDITDATVRARVKFQFLADVLAYQT